MRLFIAIELPDTVKKALAGLYKDLPGVRWVPHGQLHLTLHFLGDVDTEQLKMLCQALTAIHSKSFSLTFTRINCFPQRKSPRIIWMGLEKQAALEHLAQCVKRAVTACGIMIEERPFAPHITLARVKTPATEELRHYLAKAGSAKIPPVTVHDFVLFQSILSKEGAQHLPLHVFRFTHPT